jgi:hypothetical protein
MVIEVVSVEADEGPPELTGHAEVLVIGRPANRSAWGTSSEDSVRILKGSDTGVQL